MTAEPLVLTTAGLAILCDWLAVVSLALDYPIETALWFMLVSFVFIGALFVICIFGIFGGKQ